MKPERFENIYDSIVNQFYMAYMLQQDTLLSDLYGSIKLLKAYCNLHEDPFYTPFLYEIELLEKLYKNI